MPNSPVIRSAERTLSDPQLQDRARRAAQGLLSLGIGPGKAVALVLRNDFALFEAVAATRLAGATVVPVNWHFTERETRYVLSDSGAEMIVVHADLLPGIADAIADSVHVRVVTTPSEIARAYDVDPALCAVANGSEDWNEWLMRYPPLASACDTPGTNMLYTSGTTGHPKGVRRLPMDSGQVERYYASLTRAFGLRRGMRHLVTGPLYHSSPYGNAMVGVWLGADIDLMPRFDALSLLRTIEQRRITHMHLVPTMFVRLLKLPEAERSRFDLSSLECVCHGAAPCPVPVKQAMLAWWGPVLREYYGSTEASVLTGIDSQEWLTRPGSVGRALPGARVEIRDDSRQPLPAGEIGEIWVRLRDAPEFDYHGRTSDRRDIESDGLLTNGDVGYLDDNGYLYLCDRKRDMIISGGVNIYPAEIESALLEHPEIMDCAVFGIPDEEFGEAVAAAIQRIPHADVDAESLSVFADERLARFKVPRLFEFHTDLPRLDNGKIYKGRLRERHWQGSGRKI